MWIRVWLCLAVLTGSAPADRVEPDSLLFPRPVQLRPAIEFWKQVFTAYGTDQVILHDEVNLALVYGAESLGSRADTGQDAQRRQIQEAILARYQQALERLAQGVGDTALLAGEERRIWLALGRSVDPQCYRQARERLRLQVGQRDRFERGWQVWLRHSGKVERILRVHGVPDSLAVLPFVESMFNLRARSHAGAVGLWQITRPAGRHFLCIDERADERLDPLKATHAAAQILAHNRQVLGNWPLAITAYNHGTAGVARGVREVGSRDIAELVRRYQGPAFGFASRNFYAEFLAALEVAGQRRRQAIGQVLAAQEEWAVADSGEAIAAASAPAVPGPTGPGGSPRLAAEPATAASTADTALALPAVGAELVSFVPDQQVLSTPVVQEGEGTAGPSGWWGALRLVLAPFRELERNYLHQYVALFEWVQGCKRMFSALFAPLYA